MTMEEFLESELDCEADQEQNEQDELIEEAINELDNVLVILARLGEQSNRLKECAVHVMKAFSLLEDERDF